MGMQARRFSLPSSAAPRDPVSDRVREGPPDAAPHALSLESP